MKNIVAQIKKIDALYISAFILLVFTIIFVAKGNYEFLLYTVTIGILIFVLIKTNKIFNYSLIAKLGFGAWLLLHFLGGSLQVAGIRLYDTILIPILGEPLNIFRYDQLMHAFCYFVFVFFVYAIIKDSLKPNISKWMVAFIIVMIAEAIGAVNEIIEFLAVVLFKSEGVGDYFNNALDLIFNLIGAILGALVILRKKK